MIASTHDHVADVVFDLTNYAPLRADKRATIAILSPFRIDARLR
jgi:hypothetical protein